MRRGCGAQGRNRTTDTAIFSRMLYQLSYLGKASNRLWPVAKLGPYSELALACPARKHMRHRTGGRHGGSNLRASGKPGERGT